MQHVAKNIKFQYNDVNPRKILEALPTIMSIETLFTLCWFFFNKGGVSLIVLPTFP
jgi:hypothetical protein